MPSYVQTKLMRADEIANCFNTAFDHKHWRAVVAGTRVYPEVNFNSNTSMVTINYNVDRKEFTISFAKTKAAFGDFVASAYRGLGQILPALKASGLPLPAALDDKSLLRMEYDPRTKLVKVFLASMGDDWMEAEPLPFKVPNRDILQNDLTSRLAESTLEPSEDS